MFKWLWHILVQGHSWKILAIAGGSFNIHVLLECQKCHKIKVVGNDWAFDKYSWAPGTAQIEIDDFLDRITKGNKGK